MPGLPARDRLEVSDSAVTGPEHHLTGVRIEQPEMVVVRLIRECGGDAVDVHIPEVEHCISVGRALRP